jgi:hypothetical protein
MQAVGIWLMQVPTTGDGVLLALEKGQTILGGSLQLLRLCTADGLIRPAGFDGFV